jgi:hypothetical protein
VNETSDFSTGKSSETTTGNYSTEEEACIAFDEAIAKTELFKSYKEVCGFYLYYPHFKHQDKCPRIDRILIPLPKLTNAGWCAGAIGVEIKKSGVKLGPVISQMMDYMRATWRLSPSNVSVMLDFCFVFPSEVIGNNLGSLLSQNRIGQVSLKHYKIEFHSGDHRQIKYDFYNHEIKVKQNLFGRRTGSR